MCVLFVWPQCIRWMSLFGASLKHIHCHRWNSTQLKYVKRMPIYSAETTCLWLSIAFPTECPIDSPSQKFYLKRKWNETSCKCRAAKQQSMHSKHIHKQNICHLQNEKENFTHWLRKPAKVNFYDPLISSSKLIINVNRNRFDMLYHRRFFKKKKQKKKLRKVN